MMLETRPFRKYLFAAALAAGAFAWPVLAARASDNGGNAGGGYAGLIAPADNSSSDSTPDSASDSTLPPSSGAGGYAGLVAAPSSADVSPQIPQPSTGTAQVVVPPSPFDDQPLDTAAGAQPVDIAPILANAPSVEMPETHYNTLTANHVNGMPIMEYATQKTIAHSISTVNDQSLSAAQRLKNARQAYQYLTSLASGLRVKESIPDSIYKNMGLSDAYIHDQKVGNVAALAAVNAALQSLKPYQQDQ